MGSPSLSFKVGTYWMGPTAKWPQPIFLVSTFHSRFVFLFTVSHATYLTIQSFGHNASHFDSQGTILRKDVPD